MSAGGLSTDQVERLRGSIEGRCASIADRPGDYFLGELEGLRWVLLMLPEGAR